MIHAEGDKASFDGDKETIAVELAIVLNAIAKTIGNDVIQMAYRVLVEMEKKGTSIEVKNSAEDPPKEKPKRPRRISSKEVRDRIAKGFFKVLEGEEDE